MYSHPRIQGLCHHACAMYAFLYIKIFDVCQTYSTKKYTSYMVDAYMCTADTRPSRDTRIYKRFHNAGSHSAKSYAKPCAKHQTNDNLQVSESVSHKCKGGLSPGPAEQHDVQVARRGEAPEPPFLFSTPHPRRSARGVRAQGATRASKATDTNHQPPKPKPPTTPPTTTKTTQPPTTNHHQPPKRFCVRGSVLCVGPGRCE